MPNQAYQRGAARERELRDRLEDQKWTVVRGAGSKGPCDIAAMRKGEIWLIEVKTTATPFAGFPPAKRREMKEAADRAGGRAMLAHWPPHKVCRWLPAESWPE